ncbi:NAD-dependent epimerase/dehydratase family protein [Hellea balneolensis]|uniref:NAD-dependent epimerase/dehydratase family protein n=1 Tax=Hellea balneolensis TaxID=287478 RepID=UPI0005576878|nr:NAD-dependent epimerase/dehydratase family protein [Hellea balneolensis]
MSALKAQTFLPLNAKIIVTGASGLIGQNLCLRLKRAGYTNVVGFDKHALNTDIFRKIHPDIDCVETDLATPGKWQEAFKGADIVILNQAQIGGLFYEDFDRNNVVATRNILEACSGNKPPYIVHISSSVVNSEADDFYTRSKTQQEDIVKNWKGPYCVLRPTLMFGWFDRKHLGWLRRFMEKVPVFPIPGHGRYVRQPLYAGDFCKVIMACMEQQPDREVLDISGQEKINYIDLIRIIKKQTGVRTAIIKIPYSVFYALLKIAVMLTKTPPFTTAQLEALIIPEEFPVIDWPNRFNVTATPFAEAVKEAYTDPDYSNITLAF